MRNCLVAIAALIALNCYADAAYTKSEPFAVGDKTWTGSPPAPEPDCPIGEPGDGAPDDGC